MQGYIDIMGGTDKSQEACYNLARAYQLLGLSQLAQPLLQQCLDMPSELHRRLDTIRSNSGDGAEATDTLTEGPATGHLFPQLEGCRRDEAVASFAKRTAPPTQGEPPAKRTGDPTSLHAEAAVNLARLHVQQGAPRAARAVLFKHVVW